MPWPAAATAIGTGALVLLVSALPSSAAVLPFTGRICELALAGAAAYLVDDAAATLTTVAPTRTWRRRAPALAMGAVLIGGAWTVVLVALSWRNVPAPVLASSGELLVLGLVSVAAATVLVRHGDPEPGARVGPALALGGVSLLLLEAALDRPLLVPWHGSANGALLAVWAGAGVLALVVAGWASRDVAGISDGSWRSGAPAAGSSRPP